MTTVAMKTWIVNPYGTVPGEGWREYRSQMLAEALVARGHEVTWYISDFEHRSKTYRPAAPIQTGGMAIVPLHASSYTRNISLARVAYERSFGASFAAQAARSPRPDVVILADPSLFYSAPVLHHCRQQGSKLVLDVIDLWPELFAVLLPKPLRGLDRLAFAPLYARRARLAAAADGVVAVTRDYLDTVCPSDRFPGKPRQVAYCGLNLSEFRRHAGHSPTVELLAAFRKGASLVVCFAGTLGDAYDMNLLAAAIESCAEKGLPIRFVVAGDGPKRKQFEAQAARLPQTLRFLGSVPAQDLASVYRQCDAGLMSYVAGSTVSMPIKFYDYLAGGLAVVNSLGREAGGIVARRQVGLNYEPQQLGSLMQALQSLAADQTLLHSCKTRALALAEDFDSRRQHDLFAHFIEQVHLGAG
jgi:glycosyltransferase involved in cell wall biosynthesis